MAPIAQQRAKCCNRQMGFQWWGHIPGWVSYSRHASIVSQLQDDDMNNIFLQDNPPLHTGLRCTIVVEDHQISLTTPQEHYQRSTPKENLMSWITRSLLHSKQAHNNCWKTLLINAVLTEAMLKANENFHVSLFKSLNKICRHISVYYCHFQLITGLLSSESDNVA